MGKRRYSAAKIARTPSLKKKLAELLADFDENRKNMDLSKMLAYGHRGYISYDETELCKLFDKLYTAKIAEVAEQRKKIEEEKVNPRRAWEVSRQERALEEVNKSLSRFEELANEIFEAKFLI